MSIAPCARSPSVSILVEAVIGAGSMNALDTAREPADTLGLTRIEGWNVGFDIQHRRAVKKVNILDDQCRVMDRDEPDDGQPDRIGASWRTRRKDAMCLIIQI